MSKRARSSSNAKEVAAVVEPVVKKAKSVAAKANKDEKKTEMAKIITSAQAASAVLTVRSILWIFLYFLS